MGKAKKQSPPEDPGLPVDFLEAAGRCWGMRRASGVLVGGLGGEPFFIGRLRDALKARFGLDGDRLEQGVAVVHRAIRDDLKPLRDPRHSWVFNWDDLLPPRFFL